MPLLIVALQLLMLAVAFAVLAFLAIALIAAALGLLAVGVVLRVTGWDRRLVAYLASKAGVRVSPPVKARFDDMDGPIEAHWVIEDSRAGRPR